MGIQPTGHRNVTFLSAEEQTVNGNHSGHQLLFYWLQRKYFYIFYTPTLIKKKKKLKKYVTKFIIFQNSLASPNSPLKKANV